MEPWYCKSLIVITFHTLYKPPNSFSLRETIHFFEGSHHIQKHTMLSYPHNQNITHSLDAFTTISNLNNTPIYTFETCSPPTVSSHSPTKSKLASPSPSTPAPKLRLILNPHHTPKLRLILHPPAPDNTIRTPLTPRMPGKGKQNRVRRRKDKAFIMLGLTPCPGEMRVANGEELKGEDVKEEARDWFMGDEEWRERMGGG